MQTQDWIALAEGFEAVANEQTRARKNVTATGQICRFFSDAAPQECGNRLSAGLAVSRIALAMCRLEVL